MRKRDNKKPGAWQRCRQRNKAKKPAKPCTCGTSGLSTSCKVKEHKQRAQDLQAVGLPVEGTFTIWSEFYDPFIFGGSCYYPGGIKVDPGTKFDLGKGFFGYLVQNPVSKRTHVAEATTGAFVGDTLEKVRKDIATGDLEVMKNQVIKSAERAKSIRLMEPAEFWRRMIGAEKKS